MTPGEMRNHGINQDSIKSLFISNDIEFVKFLPINEHDLESPEAIKQLWHAVEYLNDMISEKNLTVFLHSQSGFARAATVVMIYLGLHHSPGLDEKEIIKILKASYAYCLPNLHAYY